MCFFGSRSKTQWLQELVRQSAQDRWEVTRVSRGHNVRLQSHWTSAVCVCVCVLLCVAPCFCASLRQKGSCKHIILPHSHVKLPNSAACIVVNPAVLPQAAAAAATNAPCQECFVTPTTCCCSGAFDADEPGRRMDGVFWRW